MSAEKKKVKGVMMTKVKIERIDNIVKELKQQEGFERMNFSEFIEISTEFFIKKIEEEKKGNVISIIKTQGFNLKDFKDLFKDLDNFLFNTSNKKLLELYINLTNDIDNNMDRIYKKNSLEKFEKELEKELKELKLTRGKIKCL